MNSSKSANLGTVVALTLSVALFATGCATTRVNQAPRNGGPAESYGPPVPSSPAVGPAPVQGPQETFGPPVPAAPVAAATPAYGPEPVQRRAIVLVFGPGMARSFAYAGVLRALSDRRIPVAAVLGTELGGLMAALYAKDANINSFEWALLRFKDDAFAPPRGLFARINGGRNDGNKLAAGLERIFGKRDISQSRIPVRMAVTPASGGGVMVVQSGLEREALRAAAAAPEYFTPGQLNGSEYFAASVRHPFLIAEARALGLGPVVAVDAMDPEDARQAGAIDELKGADLVIRPDLSGVGKLEFQKKTEAAFRGKQAVQDHLAELRQLAGLSSESAAGHSPDTRGEERPKP